MSRKLNFLKSSRIISRASNPTLTPNLKRNSKTSKKLKARKALNKKYIFD
jgi:hypothetical protein